MLHRPRFSGCPRERLAAPLLFLMAGSVPPDPGESFLENRIWLLMVFARPELSLLPDLVKFNFSSCRAPGRGWNLIW